MMAAATPCSSASSDLSEADSTDSDSLPENPAISERFRQRMQVCSSPLLERISCPCCQRNFRQASETLSSFRDYVKLRQKSASGLPGEMSESEVQALMTDDFLIRLLARCNCDFKRCLERLTVARVVHRKYSMDGPARCRACAQSPGYHSFRQVGFDKLGRPVLYTCLNQDLETGTQPEQIRDYFLHLIRAAIEAEKTIPPNQHALVMVFDVTGLSIDHVRASAVSQFAEMLRYFPARMSYALILNVSTVARYLLKPIIHLSGHKNEVLMLSADGIEAQLAECFDRPMVRWMLMETERNRQPKQMFCGPAAAASENGQQQHDARGEANYLNNYVLKAHPSGHMPHPSLVDPAIHGQALPLPPDPSQK